MDPFPPPASSRRQVLHDLKDATDERVKLMTPDDALFTWKDDVAHFRGLPVDHERITVAGRTFTMACLKDAADLLDHDDFAKQFLDDNRAPYGLELWPAALMMADHILNGEDGNGRRAIEIGCGSGLVSLAATTKGWRVTAADHEPLSLRFAEYAARLNGIEPAEYEVLDWRHPPQGRCFDRIFAADILYELVNHAPILTCIRRLLDDKPPPGVREPGRDRKEVVSQAQRMSMTSRNDEHSEAVALIADPNRRVADGFADLARDHGFDVSVEGACCEFRDRGRVEGRIFRLRLSAGPASEHNASER